MTDAQITDAQTTDAQLEKIRRLRSAVAMGDTLKLDAELNDAQNLPDDTVNHLLRLACQSKNYLVAKYLIEHRQADVDFQDGTPLRAAAHEQDRELVHFLVMKGADPTLDRGLVSDAEQGRYGADIGQIIMIAAQKFKAVAMAAHIQSVSNGVDPSIDAARRKLKVPVIRRDAEIDPENDRPSPALDDFILATRAIRRVLRDLTEHLENHLGFNPDEVNYGHTGSAMEILRRLEEIKRFSGAPDAPTPAEMHRASVDFDKALRLKQKDMPVFSNKWFVYSPNEAAVNSGNGYWSGGDSVNGSWKSLEEATLYDDSPKYRPPATGGDAVIMRASTEMVAQIEAYQSSLSKVPSRRSRP